MGEIYGLLSAAGLRQACANSDTQTLRIIALIFTDSNASSAIKGSNLRAIQA